MLKLRKTAPAEPLILSMTGLRLGDRVLFVGCGDPASLAHLAQKPGLTGRACAVDDDAERVARAASAAEREGALLETFTAPLISLPFEPGAFDVVVLFRQVRPLESASQAVVAEAARVVREGGRCVAIEGGTKGALARLLSAGQAVDAGAVEAAMKNAGLRGVRTLADRGGLLFVEGARRR